MAVYQCLCCRGEYGNHPDLPKLKGADPKTHHRYLDSDTWKCPHCGAHQDTRDVQPFLGIGGCNTMRQLDNEEIMDMIFPKRRFMLGGEDQWMQSP